MAPPRSSRLPDLPPPTTISHLPASRHISAKEKDILHRTHDRGIVKSKKPLATTSKSAALSASLPLDRKSTSVPPSTSTTNKQFIWLDGPGSSEARMHWSDMSNEEINIWRNTLAINISAPFSSIQAQLSLTNPDGLGQGTPSMSGPILAHAVALGTQSIRRPVSRVQLEREVALTWESRMLDEDEVLAAFVARCNEDRELGVARNSGKVVGTNAGVFDRKLEYDGVDKFGGGGRVNGTGGIKNRPVKCRSDMLAEW